MQKKWLDALKMKLCNSTMKICSDHCKPTDFHYKGEYGLKTRLKSCAVPSEKIPVTLLTKLKRNKKQDELRSERVSKRRKVSEENLGKNNNKEEDMKLDTSDRTTMSVNSSDKLPTITPTPDVSSNSTTETRIPLVEFSDKATQLVIPKEEKSTQAEEMLFEKKKKSIDDMIKSDKNLNTLTGISSIKMLEAIEASVQKLESTVPKKYYCSLSARHRIMMTFMILKLNLNYATLAVFFETTLPTAKLTITKMRSILKEVFNSGITFPDTEKVMRNIPLGVDTEENTE